MLFNVNRTAKSATINDDDDVCNNVIYAKKSAATQVTQQRVWQWTMMTINASKGSRSNNVTMLPRVTREQRIAMCMQFYPIFLKMQGCFHRMTHARLYMLVWVTLYLLIALCLKIVSHTLIVNRSTSCAFCLLLTCLNRIACTHHDSMTTV